MRFWDFEDNLTIWRKEFAKKLNHGKRDDKLADHVLAQKVKTASYHFTRRDAMASLAELHINRDWLELGRPYYNVLPSIIPMLLGLDMSQVMLDQVKLPVCPCVLRLPVGERNPLRVGDHDEMEVRGIMVGDFDNPLRSMSLSKGDARALQVTIDEHGNGFGLYIDIGEEVNGQRVHVYQTMRKLPGVSLEEEYRRHEQDTQNRLSLSKGITTRTSVIEQALRIVAAVAMIASDPDSELVSPRILSEDIELGREITPELVDKARRRGNFGFDVGKDLDRPGHEVSPHFRRAHLALRWTGEGRKIPKIVPVRSTIVRREKLHEVPTGYLDKETECAR